MGSCSDASDFTTGCKAEKQCTDVGLNGVLFLGDSSLADYDGAINVARKGRVSIKAPVG